MKEGSQRGYHCDSWDKNAWSYAQTLAPSSPLQNVLRGGRKRGLGTETKKSYIIVIIEKSGTLKTTGEIVFLSLPNHQ